MPWFDYVIFLFMAAIIIALGSGLYSLLFGKKPENTAKALTMRIGLSVLLFILLFVAFAMGWIKPHSLLMTKPPAAENQK